MGSVHDHEERRLSFEGLFAVSNDFIWDELFLESFPYRFLIVSELADLPLPLSFDRVRDIAIRAYAACVRKIIDVI